ncbi:HlyD family efflux transporter periplasmic adaptor subunit [Thalassomonas sp. RHCl1]|uniref:HlyD family secretion protein n=1 Tax=Thalassomonas sp. RHCl1 TaxID=2995320 RepID=UPI00248BBFA3|nr:HlyD family efflux transporter periplasmic adaptor subunit [Thalassomonas sp. RHCl1]
MVVKKKRSIYRQEVLEAQIARHGDVLLIRPVSFAVITGFILLLMVCIVLFLTFGDYTKSTSVKGILKTPSGVKKVMAYQAGVIEELLVKEGQVVLKEQPLYKIRTDRQGLDTSVANEKSASIKQSIHLLKEKIAFQQDLNQLELAEVIARQATLTDEAAQVNDEIALQKDYLKLLSIELSQVEKLLKDRQISKSEYNSKYAQVLEKRISLKNLSRKRRNFLTQAKEADKRKRNVEIKGNTMIVGYQEQMILLERELADIRADKFYYIKAPGPGVVSNIFYQQGHFAETNRPLMNLLPEDSQLVAEIYIPTSAIGLVEPGQDILLRYQAFPYQKFGLHQGKINSISKTLIEPFQAEVDTLIDQPAYRATVALAQQQIDAQGKMVNLQPGMLLDADVLGENRSLLAWVFEPLLTKTH